MTWINSDLNKIAKQIEMDVIKFDYNTPYNVSNAAGGTNAYNMGWTPILFTNKQTIAGVDFLPVYTYTAVTPNVPYFKLTDLDTGTYIYIFDVSFNYKGHSANEACQRYCLFSSSATVDRIWNVSGLSTNYGAFQAVSTAGTNDPLIGFDYYAQQGIKDYTLDLSNPEKTRCIFFLGGTASGAAFTNPLLTNFSFIIRNVSTSVTGAYPAGTVNNVQLTVKRIKKV